MIRRRQVYTSAKESYLYPTLGALHDELHWKALLQTTHQHSAPFDYCAPSPYKAVVLIVRCTSPQTHIAELSIHLIQCQSVSHVVYKNVLCFAAICLRGRTKQQEHSRYWLHRSLLPSPSINKKLFSIHLLVRSPAQANTHWSWIHNSGLAQ